MRPTFPQPDKRYGGFAHPVSRGKRLTVFRGRTNLSDTFWRKFGLGACFTNRSRDILPRDSVLGGEYGRYSNSVLFRNLRIRPRIVANSQNVAFRQFGAGMGLAMHVANAPYAVIFVVSVISQLKMTWVATGGIVAHVPQQLARWDNTALPNPCQMMDEPFPAVVAYSQRSVSGGVLGSSPDMAVSPNDDLILHSLAQRRSIARPVTFCGKSFRRKRFRSETYSHAAILDQTTG